MFNSRKMFALLIYCSFLYTVLCQNDTTGSRIVANYILEGLNRRANPCDDIFGFVCGRWMDYANESDTTRMENGINQILMDAINRINVNNRTMPVYKVWVRNFFDQCVRSARSRSANDEQLRQIFEGLQSFLGPPPAFMTENVAQEVFRTTNVWNLLGQGQRILADGVFFDTFVESARDDENGVTIPVLSFSVPTEEGDERLVSNEIKSWLLDLARIIGIAINPNQIDQQLTNVVNLDSQIQKYINQTAVTPENNQDANYLTDSLSQLQAVNPTIQWQEFFRGLFSDSQFNNRELNGATFQLKNRKYFEGIDRLVNSFTAETIFSYMFYKKLKQYRQIINNDNNDETTCLELAKVAYGPAVAKIYFDYINQQPTMWQNDLNIIVDNVITSFKYAANKCDWLSAEEKGNILKKANSITFTPPIPAWLDVDARVQANTIAYEANESVYQNLMDTMRQKYSLDLDDLTNNDIPDQDIRFFPDDGYQDMTIAMTLGSVLPPLYYYSYPSAVKYALFGSRIAYLLLEGFSLDNVYEIPKGVKEKWLNNNNYRKFQDELICVDNQTRTLNCADQNGRNCPRPNVTMMNDINDDVLQQIDAIKIAYSAAKLSYQNEADKQSLPNLTDYTWDQIFFMSNGRNLCSLYTVDSQTDVGGSVLTRSRLFKIFRNIPLVAQTFQCSSSGLIRANPKCGIWDSN